MIAVPSGPSARNASTPPDISPGTVVWSQGVVGMLNVDVPKPDSTGVRPVRWWMGGGLDRPRMVLRIRSMPGSASEDASPKTPRTGSSQMRVSGGLPIVTVVDDAVQAD